MPLEDCKYVSEWNLNLQLAQHSKILDYLDDYIESMRG